MKHVLSTLWHFTPAILLFISAGVGFLGDGDLATRFVTLACCALLLDIKGKLS